MDTSFSFFFFFFGVDQTDRVLFDIISRMPVVYLNI